MKVFRLKSVANKPFEKWRFYVVYGVIFLALLALIIQLAWLQLVDADKLIAEGNKRSLRYQNVYVPRAMILDRNERALAVSVPMYDVWADPKIVKQSGGVDPTNIKWQELAKSVIVPISELQQKLDQEKVRFVPLIKQITPTQADYLKQLKLKGINFNKTSKRFYPLGSSIAQLIGLTNVENGIESGAEGIEKSYNDLLIGETGQRVIRRDRFGRVIEKLQHIDGEVANDLVLSIDERLQSLVFSELENAVKFNKADSGTAVLIDINTGEVLAMATNPSYNPNNRSQINASLLRNRAVTDAFEPGSTVKPLIVMAALEKKIVDLNTIIDTRPFYVNRFEVKDVSYQRSLNLAGILEKSSNVGVSKLALKMNPHEVVGFYSRFGLGQPTGLGIGGETNGMIAANRAKWSDIERATYAFGYGLMVTPLQLARAYATIGSYGVYKPVSILKVTEPVEGQRVVSESIAKTVVKLMESVAITGGGVRAAVPDYSVAVKTGTAKKLGSSGKYVNEYIAYTAGIAPASKPRYSLVVIIDNPKAGQYYGGTVSAPVFSRIMSGVLRTMNVAPDRKQDNKNIRY
ncbi:peptidoglycan glycosyltransferase FtsI [Frischella sp. Ac48]|uniref:Peptidoglycan D,D-transpeptidase FtsI n=1 Tax=Frischella japonica TaxID=2741544 RepID=A0ABR7QVI6_9GAMM|nr:MULTISPECIES: peptidoglycan glycosyltransferase FtsI [Frischella]MBC9130196.1 peptidoglycan glycosyltransferase FtsI [Frischella japonica]MBX4133180.1 peptidoglycan glycosyltransferase FtsI [Frischella sp. Ac48]